MRLATQGFEKTLELKERAAGVADDLPTVVDQVNLVELERTDDDDIAVVATARRRASREARVGGLHDDDPVCRDTGLQDLPELRQGRGNDDSLCLALTRAEALPIAFA